MADQSVIAAVRQYLDAVRVSGVSVSFGVLYGSHARGQANKWSDIDVLVVSPMFDRQRTRKDILALWQIASYSDSRIEPVACGEREYEEDAGRMIIEIARREGIKIALEEET